MLETIVSNIFIAVIAGLILYHIFGIGKPKMKTPIPKLDAIKITETPSLKLQKGLIGELSPHDIMSAISNQPPAQRDDYMKKLNGLEVDWSLTFVRVDEEKGKYRVSLFYQKTYPWIYISVPKKGHPKLLLIHEHHPISVTGTICKVESTQIWLKKSRIIIE